MDQTRQFSKFYQQKKNKQNKRQADFKTYKVKDIEELGLMLEDGIAGLPAPMQERLRRDGITELFPVQASTFHLFV